MADVSRQANFAPINAGGARVLTTRSEYRHPWSGKPVVRIPHSRFEMMLEVKRVGFVVYFSVADLRFQVRWEAWAGAPRQAELIPSSEIRLATSAELVEFERELKRQERMNR